MKSKCSLVMMEGCNDYEFLENRFSICFLQKLHKNWIRQESYGKKIGNADPNTLSIKSNKFKVQLIISDNN